MFLFNRNVLFHYKKRVYLFLVSFHFISSANKSHSIFPPIPPPNLSQMQLIILFVCFSHFLTIPPGRHHCTCTMQLTRLFTCLRAQQSVFVVVAVIVATFYRIKPASGNFHSAAPSTPAARDSPVYKIRILPHSRGAGGAVPAIGRGARINRINDISSSVVAAAQQREIDLSMQQQLQQKQQQSQAYALQSIMVLKGPSQSNISEMKVATDDDVNETAITVVPRILRIAGGAYPVYYVIAVANGRFNGSNIRAIKSKFNAMNKSKYLY